MKPFIYLSIALGGFVTAIGTSAIVSAEYHVARTGQQVVATILAPRAYSPIELTRDDNLSSDQVASDLRMKLDANTLASLPKTPSPDIEIQSQELKRAKLELKCAQEQTRVARRQQYRASRHSYQSQPSLPTPRPMVASYGNYLPLSPKVAKGFTFISSEGKPVEFHVTPFAHMSSMSFDTKKFDKERAQFVLQMRADKHIWESMSNSDVAQLKKLGVNFKSLGALQQISVDPMKIAASAQEAASAQCSDASKSQSDENSQADAISSK